ncbi:unnamed protein product [Calypogeia fissa]
MNFLEGGLEERIERSLEKPVEDPTPVTREPRRSTMRTLKLGGPRFEIDKYDGRANYLLWERQVKGVLRAMGLGKVLRTRPNVIDEEEWDEIQEQAVSLVFLYLKPNVFKQVAVETDVSELFKSLQQKYHHKELSNRLYTSLKLMSFKMKEGDTKLQDHIDAFNDLVVDLENLGEDLSDERKTLHLLSSLPASYQSLSRILLHRDKKTITYHEVVSALQTDDLQQKLVSSSQSSSSHPSALNVERGRSKTRFDDKGKPRNKSRSKSRGKSREKGEIVCWKCSKPGHMKKDCKGKSVVSSSALVANDDEGDLLNDDYVL